VKHSDVQDHMADYLEGDLPLERRALFDAHLDDCEACLSEIREVQRTITLPSPSCDAFVRTRVGSPWSRT
jgi:anti-sigma factor RsiW